MRTVIALLVICYLVGVGVSLAPTFQANWNSGSAAQFAGSIAQDLPQAMSWPARAYRGIARSG